MKVKLAITAGFCMGVRRAMEIALAEANKGDGPFYTFGPLIHNKQVLELLESKSVIAVDNIDQLNEGTLLIRAHGIPPEQRKKLKDSNLRILDATCPRVARVQAIIRYNTNKGYTPVIVGDKDHAEVVGLMGYGKGRAHVINSKAEVENLPETEKLFVVAQTTQNEHSYQEIVEIIKKRNPQTIIFNTICEATHERQQEVRALADTVDGMVVVGGYNSGNTHRLVEISKESGIPTFHIETEKELDREKLSAMNVAGITAGASTPNWMIKKVVKELESIRSRRENFFGRWLRKTVKSMLLSSGLVALGAFSLSYASAVLSGTTPKLIYPLLAFLYIYAMHVLNRFLDKGASTYNDPEKAAFYRKNRVFLVLTGIVSAIIALILSYLLGTKIYLLMAGLCILGIIYSIPLVPMSLRHLWRYSKIKDIPGSKGLSEAFAWAVVIALLPLLGKDPIKWPSTIITFYLVFSMAYVRTALFDILQVQGDMIVGKETLPIILGENRALFLLKGIILSACLLLIIAPIFNLVTYFSFFLLVCFILLSVSLMSHEKGRIHSEPHTEYLVEASFILAGLLGLLWQGLS